MGCTCFRWLRGAGAAADAHQLCSKLGSHAINESLQSTRLAVRLLDPARKQRQAVATSTCCAGKRNLLLRMHAQAGLQRIVIRFKMQEIGSA